MAGVKVRIEGDREYQAALHRAEQDAADQMDKGLEEFGTDALAGGVAEAPKLTGELAGSGRLEVRRGSGEITFDAEHAWIIEWFDQGRFDSLSSSYGAPPRFAHRAVLEREEQLEELTGKALEPVITIDGWAH